jgi:hypothetical protein
MKTCAKCSAKAKGYCSRCWRSFCSVDFATHSCAAVGDYRFEPGDDDPANRADPATLLPMTRHCLRDVAVYKLTRPQRPEAFRKAYVTRQGIMLFPDADGTWTTATAQLQRPYACTLAEEAQLEQTRWGTAHPALRSPQIPPRVKWYPIGLGFAAPPLENYPQHGFQPGERVGLGYDDYPTQELYTILEVIVDADSQGHAFLVALRLMRSDGAKELVVNYEGGTAWRTARDGDRCSVLTYGKQ